MGLPSIHLLFFALTHGALSPISAALPPSTPLEQGYRQMYNLEFSDAHQTFRSYMQGHPGDPFGATSDAAAYLFDEFNRLGVLQTELFTDDEKFEGRSRASAHAAKSSAGQTTPTPRRAAGGAEANSPAILETRFPPME